MEDDGAGNDNVEKNILYDLTIHAEWQQEPEITGRERVREKSKVSFAGRLTAVALRSTWTFLRMIGIPLASGSPCNLPEGLVKIVSSQSNWNLSLSEDGTHAAILQDQAIEIRYARDDYSSVIGRCTMDRDPYPQWRRIVWSPNVDMLAYSDSSGNVTVFDLVGSVVCTIPSIAIPKPNTPVDLSQAIAGLIFREVKGDDECNVELMVINHLGSLRCYKITNDLHYRLSHSFEFSIHYPRGIGAVVYHEKYSILVLGGDCRIDPYGDDLTESAKHGITVWRILSDMPFYKLVTDYETDLKAAKKNQLMRRLKNIRMIPHNWYAKEQDGVYKMSLSPSGNILAVVYHSGTFSLWDIPSLRQRSLWKLEDQPGYNDLNEEIANNPKKKKQMKDFLNAYYLVDAQWWSDLAVILARGTGSLTVCSATSLKNLLGNSPEWFEPGPLITSARDESFLGLECQARYSSLKRHLVEESDSEYEDSEDEEDATMVTKATKVVKQVLYFVTDSERFHPPRKRPKLVTRNYHLVCLKSTTPEELYARKIDHEEYGEALELAKAYGLDCDLVYQRQWRKTPVSVASIQDYLSKISKRSWVLRECLERVPENIDAMRELLQYGLRGTDLEAIITIGKGEDGGRFILCDRQDVYEESIDSFDEDALLAAKEVERERRKKIAQQVNFEKLTLDQKEAIRARLKLLQYSDRLSTYEEILGGIHAAEERFDHKFFETFRAQNIVELARDYARKCDWRALDVLFTYHGTEVLPHRLAVLSNFPETFAPFEYRNLLPEANPSEDNDEGDSLSWEEQSWRDEDWCEIKECRPQVELAPPDDCIFLYEQQPKYQKYLGADLTKKQLTEWYSERAMEIDEFSRMVDYSLELVRLGMERGIQGLELLFDDLLTMEMLVYDCHMDDTVTLEHLREMPNIDKVALIMNKSSDEMYVKNVRRWLVPFLERCERQTSGSFKSLIREYMMNMAQEDLDRCLNIFQTSKADQPNPVISDEHELMTLALDCIYTCESNDQLSNAFEILECLPQRGFGVVSESSTKLHNKVDELECHLSAAEILENNGIPQTIFFIRKIQNDTEEIKKLFTKLTRVAGRKTPPLNEAQWKSLLTDMLSLRDKTFNIVKPTVCYQIFVESLLCSSRHENIKLAGEMMERSADERTQVGLKDNGTEDVTNFSKVAYKDAIPLVLSSAREYFDSSADLTDSSMTLARACLKLITDKPKEITEELELIESIALLGGFGVNMLPIQVRMSKDRLDLVKMALDAKPFTYKNSQRLLKLGKQLQIQGANQTEREGKVLKLVTEYALKSNDYGVAYELCMRLMDSGYAPIWTECKNLAEAEEFQDLQGRRELLSFAMTHCSADMIEPILRAKNLLDMQTLYEKVNSEVQGRSSQSPSESPFSAVGAIQHTREILTSTTKTTRSVIANVSDTGWWKKTLKSIQPARQGGYVAEWDDMNSKMEKQGVHPFYESIIENSYSNRSEADYKNYNLPRQIGGGTQLSETVLRTGKLEETLSEGEQLHPASEVLLQLARDVIAQDTSLGLGYLLALPKPNDAEECFNKCPHTDITLQTATYYYALQIYNVLYPYVEGTQSALYGVDPSVVIEKVVDHVANSRPSDWPEGVSDLVNQLQRYQELLTDFTQAQILQGLGRGVDVGRFTSDLEYKHETILGLSMTTEQPVYEIAVSLGQRYKVDIWDVYMTHLEYLFESGLSVSEIEGSVRQRKILHTLKGRPSEFQARMFKYVYPGLEGSNHTQLIYFYTLLEGCGDDDQTTPEEHLKLLKKIKPAAPGIDYKKLMESKINPLDVIRPVLNANNVHVIAKLAPKIPDQRGGYLQSSLVFCAWGMKMFWEGDKGKKQPSTDQEWIHRFEACGEFMKKLNAADFIQYIDGIVFVDQSLQKLSIATRQEIAKRALKYCRSQSGKSKTEENSSVTWEDATEHMKSSQTHLERLQSESIQNLFQSSDPQIQNYARQFDLTRSEPAKVENLFISMVLSGCELELISELINVVQLQNVSVEMMVRAALNNSIMGFMHPSDDKTDDSVLLESIRSVVSTVSKHRSSGGTLLKQDSVMSILRPFCANTEVAVQPRLDILRLLEEMFDLRGSDLVLLTLYRTQAIVSPIWPDSKVTERNIKDDNSRSELFSKLLDCSTTIEQFQALGKLLTIWPPLNAITENESEPSKHPWCQLISQMVKICEGASATDVVDFVRQLSADEGFSEECTKFVFQLLQGTGMGEAAVKCALLSQHVTLQDKAVEELHNVSQEQHSTEDSELLVLILKSHLVARVVDTPYYNPLVSYILDVQTGQDTPYHLSVENIVNQLQEAGYEVEAGSLLLQYKGTHPSVQLFDTALGYISNWFSR